MPVQNLICHQKCTASIYRQNSPPNWLHFKKSLLFSHFLIFIFYFPLCIHHLCSIAICVYLARYRILRRFFRYIRTLWITSKINLIPCYHTLCIHSWIAQSICCIRLLRLTYSTLLYIHHWQHHCYCCNNGKNLPF